MNPLNSAYEADKITIPSTRDNFKTAATVLSPVDVLFFGNHGKTILPHYGAILTNYRTISQLASIFRHRCCLIATLADTVPP